MCDCIAHECISFLSYSSSGQAPALTRSPQIMVDSHYMIAIKGSNVTLECKVLYITWYIAYSLWKFNGNSTILKKPGASPHYSQSKVLFSDRMTMLLDIINVSERHAGFYECSVFNTKGNDKNNITLMVVGEKGNYVFCTRFTRCVCCNISVTRESVS